MTEVRSQRLAREVVLSTDLIINALDRSLNTIGPLTPLTGPALVECNPDMRDRIDAFLKRFENAVEAGRRLFRTGLHLAGEPVQGMSMADVLNRAETLGMLESAGRWREIMAVRNSVVHEYAMQSDVAAAAINAAVGAATEALRLLVASQEVVGKLVQWP